MCAARSADAERIARLAAELGDLARLIPSCARPHFIEHSAALRSAAGELATLFLSLQQLGCQGAAEVPSALRLIAETASLAARFALVLEKCARRDRARYLVVSAVRCMERVAQQVASAALLLGPSVRCPAWFVLVVVGMTCWPSSTVQIRANYCFVLGVISSALRRGTALTRAIAVVSRLCFVRTLPIESGRVRRETESVARSSHIEKERQSVMSYSPGDWVELVLNVEGASAGQRGKVTSTGFLGELDIELANGNRLVGVDAAAVKAAPPSLHSGDGGCAAALTGLAAGLATLVAAVATAWARTRWGA